MEEKLILNERNNGKDEIKKLAKLMIFAFEFLRKKLHFSHHQMTSPILLILFHHLTQNMWLVRIFLGIQFSIFNNHLKRIISPFLTLWYKIVARGVSFYKKRSHLFKNHRHNLTHNLRTNFLLLQNAKEKEENDCWKANTLRYRHTNYRRSLYSINCESFHHFHFHLPLHMSSFIKYCIIGYLSLHLLIFWKERKNHEKEILLSNLTVIWYIYTHIYI